MFDNKHSHFGRQKCDQAQSRKTLKYKDVYNLENAVEIAT